MSGQKFSLSFTKTIEKKNLQPSAIRNDTPQERKDNTEALESIEENIMKTDGKAEETELVIPMVAIDRLSILRKIAKIKLEIKPQEEETIKVEEDNEDLPKEKKILTLDEQAEAAIIEESKKILEDWSGSDVQNNLSISNAANEDDKETRTADAKESSVDDYDQIDVSVFGAALLRGMGWQKLEGIGRVCKRVVEVIDPTSKTFGLASKLNENVKKMGEAASGNQEELLLAKGSFVFIHSGRHRGTYGVVELLDEDHLLVKSAVGQDVIREVELNIRVVSQKEYKDSSRVINKDMYDKFKEEEARKNQKKKSRSSKNSDDGDSAEVKPNRKEEQISQKIQKRERIKEEIPSQTMQQERENIKEEKTTVVTPTFKEPPKSTDRDKFKNKMKQIENERRMSPVEKEHDQINRKNEEDSYSVVDKVRDRLQEYSKSKYEKDEARCKDQEKSNRHKNKYKSSSSEKYGSSRHYTNKEQDTYDNDSDDKYSQKFKRVNESQSQKRREDKSDIYSQEYKKAKKAQEQMPEIPWVRENLRVRLINKDYKGGRYHKQKVIVKLVETAESCECITEEGKTLREVHPGCLETVIPKVEPQNIMIVKGNQKGQRGRILQLHKDQEKASVQLMEDTTVIVKLHYDDICEYVSQY